jgi:hypothetical protein
VGHRGVVDVDEVVLAKIPEVFPREGHAQVGDNLVGYSNRWVMSSMNLAATFDVTVATALLTVKIRQPSHEFTFGVGMSFIPYPLVLTPVV